MENNAKIRAFDPIAENNARKIFTDDSISYKDTIKDTIIGSDIVILLTSSVEFSNISSIIDKQDIIPLVIDGRRFLDKNKFKKYEGIGIK